MPDLSDGHELRVWGLVPDDGPAFIADMSVALHKSAQSGEGWMESR